MTDTGGFVTLSVLTFAVTWAGCLTLAVAGAVSLGDRQRPIGEFDTGALYAALDEQPRGNAALPDVGPGKILRFDTRSLHAALDAQRVDRGMTWQQVADQIGISPASLTRLAKGGRTTFPQVMRMTGWLGRPAADFTRASDR